MFLTRIILTVKTKSPSFKACIVTTFASQNQANNNIEKYIDGTKECLGCIRVLILQGALHPIGSKGQV